MRGIPSTATDAIKFHRPSMHISCRGAVGIGTKNVRRYWNKMPEYDVKSIFGKTKSYLINEICLKYMYFQITYHFVFQFVNCMQ